MTKQRGKFSVKNLLKKLLIFCVISFVLLSLPFIALRWLNPPTTAFMQHNLAKMRADGYPNASLRWQWVAYGQIAKPMRLAAVAAEDQLFPEHRGFDIAAIREAYADIQAGKDFRGASSLSQQTVKNLFLWRDQSLFRKGVEAAGTVLLELYVPKQRILEIYLNIAQFDANVFGVEAATEKFFNKPAAQLNAAEAALLAAALPGPSIYKVESPSAYHRERQAWIVDQMARLGPNYLKRIDAQEDAMSGTAWLITFLVFGFIIGMAWHTWKALRSSNALLKNIDKSKLNDLDEDDWEKED